jgi:hypothetical protein
LQSPKGEYVPGVIEQAVSLVASIKKNCPTATIIQLTDGQTAEVPGVDLCRRFEYDGEDFQLWKTGLLGYCLSDLPEEALWGVVDTDTLILRDPEPLLDGTLFDVAMNARGWGPSKEEGVQDYLNQLMRYNGGVVFGRGSLFMQRAAIIYNATVSETNDETLNPLVKDWFGDQIAYSMACKDFILYELPDKFNFVPSEEGELPDGVVIAHYKGEKRKLWQQKYARLHCKTSRIILGN